MIVDLYAPGGGVLHFKWLLEGIHGVKSPKLVAPFRDYVLVAEERTNG